MAELVAVQDGLALFKAGDVGVLVDTETLNPYDPQPLTTLLAAGDWTTDNVTASPVCFELADAVLDAEITASASASDQRQVRVPKKVQDAVRTGLDALNHDENARVSVVAAGVAASLASGTVTVAQAKRVHQQLSSVDPAPQQALRLIYGGDAGREWSAKVCGAPVTAAVPDPAPMPMPMPMTPQADDTDFVDPDQPHVFVVLVEGDPACSICGQPADDPVHVPADQVDAGPGPADEADDGITYFAAFALGGDMGPTFKVDQLFAKDGTGAWWLREFGEWTPTQAPDDGDDIVQLDAESFSAAAAQLDEPGTAYAELSLSEERLFELASPYLNMDVLDAVFAAVPYISPEVRSANAKRQTRDSKGHFIVQGGQVQDSAGQRGTVTGVNHEKGLVDVKGQDGQVKQVPANTVTVDHNADASAPPAGSGAATARLPAPPTLVTDLHGLIRQYQERWAEESGSDPLTAAADDSVLIPPDGPSPGGTPAPTASGPVPPTSDPQDDPNAPDDPIDAAKVTPLYLAQVDPQDTEAVLACFAVLPAKRKGEQVAVYKRASGEWQADPTDQRALTGPTPPPLVELDQQSLSNVLQQMDGAPAVAASAATEVEPGYAVLQKFAITASGELTVSQVRGARLLSSYGSADTWTQDVRDRLNEFVAGKEVTPEDFKNTERLRQYWTHGEGGAKIRWGEPNDWYRCVEHLSKFLGTRARGYCTLRHHDMLGVWPGQEDGGKNSPGGHK